MRGSLSEIEPISTSHMAGMKRVPMAANESDCSNGRGTGNWHKKSSLT